MKKFILTLMAAALMPVLAMAQGCPSSEPVTATVRLQFTVENMLEGEFSISQNKRVNFSKGNLQYKASAAGTKLDPNWFFAEHQWDYIGNRAGNTAAAANRATQSDTIDLFGWATSGNPASNCEGYQPWYNGQNNNHYGFYYYQSYSSGKEWNSEHSDWGVVNAIQLGVGWRVLTYKEWSYLMDTRVASLVGSTPNARYAKAFLFGTYHGVILFPDEYTHPDGVALPTGINQANSTSWNANTYSAEDWAKMEAAGCVFLPAAGQRTGETTVVNVNASAGYWSATATGTANTAYFFTMTSSTFACTSDNRKNGNSVRLVKDVVE